MNALTFHGRETIRYEDIPEPALQSPGDVIVRVEACSICGSDLHPYHEREKGLDHGCTMGHEFTGELVEAGTDVKKLQIGDRVVSPFTVSCGSCYYCQRGLSSRCVHSQLFGWRARGQGLHGGQAEYVRVPMADSTLVKRPDGMRDETAILLGDILATGYFCARQSMVDPEGVQVVVGCGPVGLMAIWAARRLGARRIYAIDSVAHRLEWARKWGATPINYLQEDALAIVRDATQGRGADQVLEVVGLEAAIRSAFELVRPGGTLSAVGVCTGRHLPFSPVEAYDRNLTYRIGRCPARSLLTDVLEWAQEDADQLATLFTHHLPLEEGVEAYRMFDQKSDQCMKVLLRP